LDNYLSIINFGYHDVVQTASEQTIWDAESYNERGQITSYNLGNTYQTTREWDTYGFPKKIRTKTIGHTITQKNLDYVFDTVKGNLDKRSSSKYYVFEKFRYDPKMARTSFVRATFLNICN